MDGQKRQCVTCCGVWPLTKEYWRVLRNRQIYEPAKSNPSKLAYQCLECDNALQRWYERTPEAKAKKATRAKVRRTRKQSLPAIWNEELEQQMFETFNYRCAYCGNQTGMLSQMRLEVDHYIPLNAGQLCPGSVPWNMVPACKKCNLEKRAKDPRKWLVETKGKRHGLSAARKIEAYLKAKQAEYDEKGEG